LDDSVAILATAYDSMFRLHALGISQMLCIIIFGILFGIVGSWISADRHLYRLDRG
jgi:cell division protein FtsX